MTFIEEIEKPVDPLVMESKSPICDWPSASVTKVYDHYYGTLGVRNEEFPCDFETIQELLKDDVW
jgi:hypothetical protein